MDADDDDEFSMDEKAAAPNLGLDFFSQPPSFGAAATSSGGHGAYRRNGAGEVDGLDLNSQAVDFPENMSFLELLRSPASGVVGDGERGGTDRAVVHAAGRGAGVGRGNVRGGGGSTGKVPNNKFAIPSRTAGAARRHGSSTGCGAGVRPPVPPAARQFRAPRPSIGRSKLAGPAANAGDGGLSGGLHELDSSAWSQNPIDEEADDVQDQYASRDEVFDKADWANNANSAAFCELCVEEIRAGNRNNGYLTGTGYKNLAQKFEDRTGLRHSRQQFKNRWEALRRLYAFWLWLNKQSGLGRSKGTVVADDEWWKKQTKNHSDWRKLRYGPPENLAELEVMFENIAVDGSSSCIPGEHLSDNEEGAAVDGADGSPISTCKLKRTNSTNSTATSPKKKTKSPMVKVMKGIWETMQATSSIAQKALQGDFTSESIKQVMRLAVECGATEGTDEHFMATKLFVKPEHRAMFLTFETKEGRLDWLKRWCREKKIN